MAKSDPMLARIRAFDRARGGGVAVERANKGYSLFSVATGAPLARLRPTGKDDEVEILWWRHGRWVSIRWGSPCAGAEGWEDRRSA